MFHYLIKSIMAKSDSFFGLRRGSTKTLTFSVLKGKQITKDRVEGGRNPRTPEQMVQRMCMATASAAYAQMKQIVDHSFEGITYGQTTMSEFIRVNAEALRENYYSDNSVLRDFKFSYNPYRDRSVYGGAYIMSRGTASPIGTQNYSLVGSSTANKLKLMIYGDSTTQNSADSIISNLGIEVGDMATICSLYEVDADATARFVFVRITALKGGTTAVTATNFNEYFKVESNVNVSAPTVDGVEFTFQIDAPGILTGSEAVFTRCAIHSKKMNGKWLRSDAQMDMTYYVARPNADDAFDTYPVGPSYVLNGGAIEE